MAISTRGRACEIGASSDADIDAVMEIERLSFKVPSSRAMFEEEMRREWAALDVVRAGGRVVAFVNFWLVRDEVHVLNVATHPRERRHGHASRLIEHVLEFARRQKCRYVTLEVRRSNLGALALYRGHGFRAVGVRPNYYVEDREDAIVMLYDFETPAGGPEHSGDPRDRGA